MSYSLNIEKNLLSSNSYNVSICLRMETRNLLRDDSFNELREFRK